MDFLDGDTAIPPVGCGIGDNLDEGQERGDRLMLHNLAVVGLGANTSWLKCKRSEEGLRTSDGVDIEALLRRLDDVVKDRCLSFPVDHSGE